MREKLYIIKAEYGSYMPYYIGIDKNQKIFMDKLRAWQIAEEDFGYTLEEAEQILKMQKAHAKVKMKEHKKYLQTFIEHGLYPPTSGPYLAQKYYLIRKSKLAKRIEKIKSASGSIGYKWRENERQKTTIK